MTINLRWRGNRAILAAALVAASFAVGTSAQASHPEASLPGSNFEIDTDANLKRDDPAPSTDWGVLAHPNGPEIRATDVATGTNDDSYKGGVKEDTACPDETTGSIPNNKSDLLTFHVYEEPGSGTHPGFLNLAWSRVTDPSGTTLMDFEFNQSSTNCSVGPNKVRTAGDLLIEYAIDQGGSQAQITGRTWTGTAWGAPADLDVPSATCGGNPCAAGTINSSTIPATESDGLIASGSLAARTFGEAQLDLRLIFQADKCTSFGAAMLKSRSSDAFNSQLKDFIRPVGIDLTNCGKVIIRKQTDPEEDPNTTDFGYTKAFGTDPATPNTFTLKDDGVQTFAKVLFGSGYTVDETTVPAGWDFVSVDCSASTGVTPTISGSLVTFAIDDEDDVLDCTYLNRARAALTVVKITQDGAGTFDFTSGSLTPAAFSLTTTAAGAAGKDSRRFSNLAPGTYDVAETVPDFWNLVSATCDNLDTPDAVTLAAGDDVTCTFVDARERGAIEVTKTRKHAAGGSEDQPHPGVVFTITGGELPAAGVQVTTDSNGVACASGLVVSGLVGDYTVTETVPAGYTPDGATAKSVTVTEGTCASGQSGVSFHNIPLTDVTVSVDSQIDGGTASTISCVDADGNVVDEDLTNAPGDVSLEIPDLEPTAPANTLVCTIVVDP